MSNHRKAVLNGVLQHVSPSQISTFTRCPRLWYFDKVVGLRQPPTKAQADGEQIHKQLENYYESGTLPTHETALRVVKEALPAFGATNVHSEYPRDYNLDMQAAGVPLIGRLDLLVVQDIPHIVDFKTCGSFRYMLSERDLANSPQMVTYGHFVASKFKTQEVFVSHLYIHKTSNEFKWSSAALKAKTAAKRFEKVVVKPAASMIQAAEAKDYSEVEGNKSACNDYGGCPHYAKCHKAAQTGSEYSMFPSEEPKVNETKPEAATGGKLVLFIDCMPTTGFADAQNLEAEIETRSAPLREKHGVQDLRQAKFGVGMADLAATFREKPIYGAWKCTSSGTSGYVVDALVGRASEVIRGIK
jgi:hypothetical protein